MEMSTQYAKARMQQDSHTEPKVCNCSGCNGIPVFNGMCVFHSVAQDQYVRGAMSVVLRNHPIYHKLLNTARLCMVYDPPKNSEEWKVVFYCAKLLDRVKLLPEGLDLSDKKLFQACVDGATRARINGKRFDATMIGMTLENFLVEHVLAEAHRVLESTKNIDSLLSSFDRAEEQKHAQFRKEDFAEFSRLPMFNPKPEAA